MIRSRELILYTMPGINVDDKNVKKYINLIYRSQYIS